jgi:hypothetical protein
LRDHLADRRHQPGVIVGHDQFDALQAALRCALAEFIASKPANEACATWIRAW